MPCLVSNPWHRTRFTSLPLPSSALPGAWNWSCRRHPGLVVSAVYMVKMTSRTGCEILFWRILRRGRRVPCWLRVLHLCCWQSIIVLFRDRDTWLYNKVRELILEGLFIMNLYQMDKQSTKFTIWKYWKDCVKKLDRNDQNFLPATHGSCITTMHLLTRHCLWRSF